MPVYDYLHTDGIGEECVPLFEVQHSMSQRLERCPVCGHPVKKVLSTFSRGKDILSSSNIKEKGFTRWKRKSKGVYEQD